MNERDLELLSAYLDGELSPSESAQLETRLTSDPSLRDALNDLRATRSLLRQLPARGAPRNFTLTPQMAGVKPPTPRAIPVFRFATAITAFLFIMTVVINGLIAFSAPSFPTAQMESSAGAVAPSSASQKSMPAAQAPLPLAPNATTETPMPLGGGPSTTKTSTPEMVLKSNAAQLENSQPSNIRHKSSLPFDLEILFGFLAVGFGIIAWILPQKNEINFRKKWKKKK